MSKHTRNRSITKRTIVSLEPSYCCLSEATGYWAWFRGCSGTESITTDQVRSGAT